MLAEQLTGQELGGVKLFPEGSAEGVLVPLSLPCPPNRNRSPLLSKWMPQSGARSGIETAFSRILGQISGSPQNMESIAEYGPAPHSNMKRVTEMQHL